MISEIKTVDVIYGLASLFTTFKGVQVIWKTVIRNNLKEKTKHPKASPGDRDELNRCTEPETSSFLSDALESHTTKSQPCGSTRYPPEGSKTQVNPSAPTPRGPSRLIGSRCTFGCNRCACHAGQHREDRSEWPLHAVLWHLKRHFINKQSAGQSPNKGGGASTTVPLEHFQKGTLEFSVHVNARADV